MWDKLKNAANNLVMEGSKKLYPPPETDQFLNNGQLSPDEFRRAGDHLTEVIQITFVDLQWLEMEANFKFKLQVKVLG
jgi:hypothetical protein